MAQRVHSLYKVAFAVKNLFFILFQIIIKKFDRIENYKKTGQNFVKVIFS